MPLILRLQLRYRQDDLPLIRMAYARELIRVIGSQPGSVGCHQGVQLRGV